MKKTNFKLTGFIVLGVVLLTSCNSGNEEAIKKITKERDSLIEAAGQKDSSMHSFVRSLAEIEKNLVNVRQKEEILSVHAKSNVELKGNVTDEINQNIKAINELMDKNSKHMTDLNSKLKLANFEVAELANMTAALGLQLAYKNKDLVILNKLLMAKNKLIMELGGASFAFANQDINEMDTIRKQKAELNTAYYIFANHKDLKDKKIIDEQGKLLGIFKEEKLNSDLSKEYFKVIDIHQKTTIPSGWRMVTKSAKFLTNHPSSSYKFIKDEKGMITNIEITDPDNFWKISKFLVVEVD